jgi:SAM-dependent methyltransferase
LGVEEIGEGAGKQIMQLKRSNSLLNGEPITFWEKVAESRWGKYISDIEKQAIIEANLMVGVPTTALEIGCDGGRWSKLLSYLGWNMICTDVDKISLNICQNRIPSANCILMKPDDKILPLEPGSIGLLLCVEVFPVIESDWFLSEAFRVMSDNGVIVGVFLNRCSLRGFYTNITERLRNNKTFRHYTNSYTLWKKKMRNSGFVVLHEQGFCWFPFTRASNSSLIPTFTFIERLLGLRSISSVSPWIVFIAKKDASQTRSSMEQP